MDIGIVKSFWNNPSLVTGLRMSVAAILAFLICQLLHFPQGFWAVVSVAAVTQIEVTCTLRKIIWRMIGTCIGALLGYGLAFYAGHPIILLVAVFGILVVMISYITIQQTIYSYASTITGLTLIIVLASNLTYGVMFQWTLYRAYEVALGMLLIGLVTLIFE